MARESSAGTSVFPAAGTSAAHVGVRRAVAGAGARAQQRFAYWSESQATTAESVDAVGRAGRAAPPRSAPRC